jgi:phage FluMu protein Com
VIDGTPERPMAERSLETWRCPRCSRILAKVRLEPGSEVEVKCGSCNSFSTREVASTRS